MQASLNQDIREAIKKSNLYQWQIAKACGVNEVNFIRWLRDELPEERRKAIFKAIEELSREEV